MLISQCYVAIASGLIAFVAASPLASQLHRFIGPDGEDLPIQYTHEAPAHIRKRANTPVNCDPGIDGMQYNQIQSYCRREISPQAWACWGTLYDLNGTSEFHDTSGTCSETQICVDGIQTTGAFGMASLTTFCSDLQAYVAISQTMVAKMKANPTQNPIQWFYGGGQGDNHAVEAVFTDGDDPTTSVTLDNLDITAEASRLILGKSSWSPLGSNACSSCSSLGIDPVPPQTSLFQFHASFPASVSSGRIYFWTM